MTLISCKPMMKKIDTLLKMSGPSNRKQVRSFLGAVNFYKSMWLRHTHVLAPLTRLTGQVSFNQDPTCQQAFDEMKEVLVTHCQNMYGDLNKSFTIVCAASDYQLGLCILQDGRPVLAYWSIGGKLVIYIDHKNLTFRTLSTQRVLRWRN